MKLDIDLIKNILVDIEKNTDGINEVETHYHSLNKYDKKKKNYHIKILIDNDFIDGKIIDATDCDGKYYILKYTGLKLQGHQLLETLKNDNLKNKILDSAKEIGISTLKEIPSLALRCFGS